MLLRTRRSPALYSKDRSDPRRMCYERRLEDTARCVGWGNPRFAARQGLLRKRDGLRHDGWHGADDGRIHDGRWPLRHAVRRTVLGLAPGPAGRCGGVDLQPGPAQVAFERAANFGEPSTGEVRRIYLLRTRVNKGKRARTVGRPGPLRRGDRLASPR